MNIENVSWKVAVRVGTDMSSDTDLGRAVGLLPGSDAYIFVNTPGLALGVLHSSTRSGGNATVVAFGFARIKMLQVASYGNPLTIGASGAFLPAGAGFGPLYGASSGTNVGSASSQVVGRHFGPLGLRGAQGGTNSNMWGYAFVDFVSGPKFIPVSAYPLF